MLTRREFLRNSLYGTMAVKLSPELIIKHEERKKVVAKLRLKTESSIFDEKFWSDKFDKAMCRITGSESVVEAWKSLFNAGERVGIKLNPTSPPAFSRPETVNMILKGLNMAGIRNRDIIIWDRFENDLKKSGFRKSNFSTDIKIMSTEPEGIFHKDIIYLTENDTARERSEKFGKNSLISNIMEDYVDKSINIGAAKDHMSAGVTLCLKSMSFGVMNNTRRFHAAPLNCDPAIPEVYNLPGIADKTVLSFIDAIYTIYNGGPNFYSQWAEKTDEIYISKDPVALDRVVAEHIDNLREMAGFRKLMNTSKPYRHIFTAEKMGLGVADLNKIEIIEF